MSYKRLHRERIILNEKLPLLVEQEKYEDAQKIKDLLELSKTNPREFLSNFEYSPIDEVETIEERTIVFKLVYALNSYRQEYKLEPTFLDAYYYHNALFKNELFPNVYLDMLNDDLKDAKEIEKIDYFVLAAYELDLNIDLKTNKCYNEYKEIIEKSKQFY